MNKYTRQLGVMMLLVLPLTASATQFFECQSEQCKGYFKKYKWYASQGHRAAKVALGAMYFYGYGTERNITKSLREYEVAASYGSDLASYRAAIIYLTDSQIENDSKGLLYLVKSAENGFLESIFSLAVIYLNGDYGTKDIERADHWLTAAYLNQHVGMKGVVEQIIEQPSFELSDYPRLMKALNERRFGSSESTPSKPFKEIKSLSAISVASTESI